MILAPDMKVTIAAPIADFYVNSAGACFPGNAMEIRRRLGLA